ncbi:MAG: glycosyltransferase family 4 protein [Methanocorpusculum parvum]|nr:glycosyltransferase family 4 protein [Methanocorpusculum parvum]
MKQDKLFYYSSSKTQNQVELYKDPGEIPHYFNKLFGYDAIIDDYYDPSYNYDQFHNVTLLKPFSHIKCINFIAKLLRLFVHARKIDILYLLQITPDSMFKMLAYRLGGGRGKIYLKLDLGLYSKNGKDLLKWENMSLFLKIVHFLFKPLPDVYTVETKRSYERLRNSYYGDLIEKGKLFRLPNGFDNDLLTDIGLKRRNLPNKEKVIIHVSRMGDYLKNTEMLLRILERLSFKDWKIYLIGSISPSLHPKIESMYINNPKLRESIIFTGDISDKQILYEYYDMSRVFIFTSVYESYAFALLEAAYMKNYILSTPVGIAPELLEFAPGKLIDNDDAFVSELQKIIDFSDTELNDLIPDSDDLECLTWEFILKNNSGIQKLIY